MANRIFQTLLIEQIDIFKNSFSAVSQQVFINPQTGKPIHPGEYGMFRETSCRNFLSNFIPQRLAVSQGFIINTADEVSHQCDVVIFDANATPLIRSEGHQRFFPIETVCAIGEIKSSVSKDDLRKSLRKLVKVKRMREQIASPVFIYRDRPGTFSPSDYQFDQIFSFIICQKFKFEPRSLVLEIDDLYTKGTPSRFKHNLILSLNDGLLLYDYG